MLEALVELIAEQGYARTTVGGIAAKAGVSRTTFYEQFGSKEECFRVAYDTVVEHLVEAIVAAVGNIKDRRKQMRAGIDAALRYCAEHPGAAATFIAEVHTAGPEALEQRYRVHERFCDVIDSYVPDVPPAASMAVVTSIDAMAHNLIRQRRASELPKLSDDAQYVAEKLLG